MTAYGNIAFGLKLQHRPKAEIDTRVRAVASVLDIAHLLDRKPGQMSGGQQQRVALGRALVKEPALFLLDEPFSNLDAALRSRMRTEVKHLHLRLGTTSVFVTHDQEEAMTLSDIIAVMRDGKLVQAGPQAEIYGRPSTCTWPRSWASRAWACWKAASSPNGTEVAFAGDGVLIGLGTADELGLDGTGNGEVTLGIRAEDLRDPAGRGRGRAAGVRCHGPAAGAHRLRYLRGALGRRDLTGLAGRAGPAGGHRAAGAGRGRGRVHLFDRTTGNRLNR